MADKSAIEWTEATWNPVTGCDRVSAGCDHCYAQTLAKRLKAMGSAKYQNDGDPRTSGPGFGITGIDEGGPENVLEIDASHRRHAPQMLYCGKRLDPAFSPGVDRLRRRADPP